MMTIGEALVVSLIGVCVVMTILAIIAVLIILISKIIRAVENIISKKKIAAPSTPAAAPAAAPTPVADGANIGEVELIGTDEKTAAVIMAIVSQKSEIPLNRLSFKSIRLMDENEKGGNK